MIKISAGQISKLGSAALLPCSIGETTLLAQKLANSGPNVSKLADGFLKDLKERNGVALDSAFENPTFQKELSSFFWEYSISAVSLLNKPAGETISLSLKAKTVLSSEKAYLASRDPLEKAAAAGEIIRVASELTLDKAIEVMPVKKIPVIGGIAQEFIELGVQGLAVPVAWLTAYTYGFIAKR